MAEVKPAGWFRRLILPGFAFKAVVIGGGYATGRELAEFFMPSGAGGGVLGLLLAAGLWSLICCITCLFARSTQAFDYRSFFKQLLGPFWGVFELAYILFMVVVLAVFGAAAGAIGHALFGLPSVVGAVLLAGLIAGVATFGNESVERLFKYVSLLLYAVYALFLTLAVAKFGDRIGAAFARPDIRPGWASGGLSYAGYNLVGAVIILPVVRHIRSSRDAAVAGVLAGPLAIAPALLFFLCMAAWPEARGSALPSDFLLERLNLPVVRLVFQIMIFSALLESGTGIVHAVNQRIAATLAADGAGLPKGVRLAISLAILAPSMFLADRFGLVQLIAKGYRLLSWAFLAVFVFPLLTIGVARLLRRQGDVQRERPGLPWRSNGVGPRP
jgi:uncharacterized membrane protein YkvI